MQDGAENREAIRVLIAEDEAPLRDALVALIGGESDLRIVGVATDVDAALAAAQETKPDVILQDVRIPGGGGTRVAREVAALVPDARVIALSAYADRANV